MVDIEMHSYVVLNSLKRKGFEVIIAQNCRTMSDMVYREKLDLILTEPDV